MKKLTYIIIVFAAVAAALTSVLLIMSTTGNNAELKDDSSLTHVFLEGKYCTADEEWLPLSENTNLSYSGCETVTIRGHFSEDIPKGKKVMLHISDMCVVFRINGSKVFSFGESDDRLSFVNSSGKAWSGFISGGISKDDAVEITLHNFYSDSPPKIYNDFIGKIYYGDEIVLFRELFHDALPVLLISLFLVFTGIVVIIGALIYYSVSPSDVGSFRSFGLFVLFAGFYFGINYNIASYFFPYPVFWTIASTMSAFLMVIFLDIYIADMLKSRFRIVINGFALINAIFVIIVALHQMFGISDVYEYVAIFMVLSAVEACVAVVAIIYEVIRLSNEYARSLTYSLLFAAAGGLYEIINYKLRITSYGLILLICILLFVVMHIFISIRIIKKNLVTLQEKQRTENELLQSRIAVMLTQIKPHFIYNSLNAISGLCLTDPVKADESMVDFSTYLRANIDALQSDEPIRFSKELDHIQHYVSLEQLRFGERINVQYDIGFSEFYVPTLTIQPIVENAIKHGIAPKIEGGTVYIKTKKQGENVIITITDDGVGFDIKSKKKSAADTLDNDNISVGMNNVKSRLKYIANADMIIKSKIGTGTKITVTIPLDFKPADK